ncbi:MULTISPECIES: transposase [unclassified Stenotrophomonas]|uniref:transposase n=1 Tax=unclassified Stenotrophomonas TaxID=196198 RepID=UPI003F9D5409
MTARSPCSTDVIDERWAFVAQSTCGSGPRAGYDGNKRKNGSKVHIAVDTLGHILPAQVMLANEQERAQVGTLARKVQHVTGQAVKPACVSEGYICFKVRNAL